MDPRRLCHISDLPNNLHFLPIEIKHLLPIHHPKLIDNVFTILSNQADSLKWPIYHDQSLTLSATEYSFLAGGWCEDIDGTGQHLKASLELSSIILNYIHSLITSQLPQKESIPLKAIQRTDHICDGNPYYSNRVMTLPTVYAYNIYKTRDKSQKTKCIFMIGKHEQQESRLCGLLNAVRLWNIKRLKSDSCNDIVPKRAHKFIQHLVMIFRGFFSQEDDQVKRRQLQILLARIDEQKLPSPVPREGLDPKCALLFSRLEYNYKDLFGKKGLFMFCSEVVAELVRIMPNSSCSFAGKVVYEPKFNQLVVLWLTAFKQTSALQAINDDTIAETMLKAARFLRLKSTEQIKNGTVNIADQMLRSSLKVLNKYQPSNQHNQLRHNSSLSSGDQLRNYPSESNFSEHIENMSRYSKLSKVSFRERNMRNDSSRDLRGTNIAGFESLSSSLMVHREKQYIQLLATIEDWQQTYGKVLRSSEVKEGLKRNCQIASRKRQQHQKNQVQLMLAVTSLKYYLDFDEMAKLLISYPDYQQCIFQVIFQKNNKSYLLEVGIKIAGTCCQTLYQGYLSNQQRVKRDHLMITFLKRFRNLFCKISKTPSLTDCVSTPLLLDILESKDYSSPSYRQLVTPLLDSIFSDTEPLRAICPILYQIYEQLRQTHHQELVNGLVADICFEVIYFWFDILFISNIPYRQEPNLKEKKIREALREGGFKYLAFQLKPNLLTTISLHRSYILPPTQVYEQIVISRPSHIPQFIDIVSKSQHTQHFVKIKLFFQQLQAKSSILKPITCIFLKQDVLNFRFDIKEEKIELAGRKSQSGIFEHLLAYNPQIKIAGMSLSQALLNRQTASKDINYDLFDVNHILNQVLKINLDEAYEYLTVVLNLKQKYEHYELLKEDEKIYLKEIMHQVLSKKDWIYQYLQLDASCKLSIEDDIF